MLLTILVLLFITVYFVFIFLHSCVVCTEFHTYVERHGEVGFLEGYGLILDLINRRWSDAIEWGNFICLVLIWILKISVLLFCYPIYTLFWIIKAIFIFLLKKR